MQPSSPMSASIAAFILNPIIMSTASSWFVAQFIKSMVVLFSESRKSFREVLLALIWRTGGMPSSHSAVVISMTTAVAFNEGVGSNLFAVSLFVAMVVLRDAMGVRRATGLQGMALNLLGKQIAEKQGVEFHPVKEIQGHTPLEVIIGGILGFCISAIFAWL